MKRGRRFHAIQIAAIGASLLMSTGLVLRISATLSPIAPETRTDTGASRAIVLRDGAQGVTLFDDVILAPGESAERCVAIRATGTRDPGDVMLTAAAVVAPELADWLHVEITRGRELGDGRQCTGYEPVELLATGTAGEVGTALGTGVAWTPSADDAIPGGRGTTYRVAATLAPDAPNSVQGAEMRFDLEWVTQFERTGEGLLQQSLALAVRFTEDSMIPMLAILTIAIMFLGIQDRLDTATPRLAQAALVDEVVEFE